MFFDVPVAGGDLRVTRWGSGPSLVLGIHGVTGSSMGMAAVAAQLDGQSSMVAPDLRGRGASASLPGPFGMRAHAEDCAAALEHLDAGPTLVVGHSMGAYVGVVLAAMRPELVSQLILVDGGLPFPPMPGIDADVALAALLGPALERLRQDFASLDEYRKYWQAHPALVGEWNRSLDAYIAYDLEGEPPRLRSRVREVAVRADSAEGLRDPELIPSSFRALACPVLLLRATRGLLNQPLPLLADPLVQQWQREVPQLVDEVVPDTNHYTIVFADRGARLIAERIRERQLST